jgi:lipid-A-disaccharide synthase
VLVDSPDFNLPLARALRRAGIPVVVYVSPQLWAWRQGRVRRIRRDARRVLCVLPFEVPFYERHGVAAEYVGHPLVDELDEVLQHPPARADDASRCCPARAGTRSPRCFRRWQRRRPRSSASAPACASGWWRRRGSTSGDCGSSPRR